jgi:sigma-B regulation protein RsbU (phosphoserine phosphatase)
VRVRIQIAVQWLGRSGIAFLLLLAAYLVAGWLAPASLLRIVLLSALGATGLWLAIRLLRAGVNRAIWRLRNRLLITYLFIAVVPIALIAFLALAEGYSLVSQLAVYLVTSELDRRMDALVQAAARLAQMNPERRAVEAPRLLELLSRSGEPQIEAVLRQSQHEFRFPPDSTLPAPPKGSRETSGVMLLARRPYLWSYRKIETGDITIAQPLTREFLAGLVPNLGMVDFADPPAGQATRVVRLAAAGAAPARSLPPAANRFDSEVRWFATIPADAWESPARPAEDPPEFLIAVRTRVSAVLATVFNRSADLAQGALKILLIINVVCFVVVEMISLVVGATMTRTITGAVHRLYEGTRKVIEGDFSHRIEVTGKDQLAELSESFNRMTDHIQHLLAVAKEKERLQSEIEIAREVQNQLYPREAPCTKALRITAVCRPARLVSGDYYDYRVASDARVALAVGDVAGKGISAALLMTTLQSSLRAQLQGAREMAAAAGNGGGAALSTSRLVAQLNGQLYSTTSPEKYATLCLGLFDERSGVLTYTNAGHLPPLLIRRGEVQRLEVNGTVVGAFPSVPYGENRLALEPGDLLVCFTDGVTEPENSYGEMFGEDRFIRVVVRSAHLSESEIADAVVASIRDWTGTDELQDDLTLLLARRA